MKQCQRCYAANRRAESPLQVSDDNTLVYFILYTCGPIYQQCIYGLAQSGCTCIVCMIHSSTSPALGGAANREWSRQFKATPAGMYVCRFMYELSPLNVCLYNVHYITLRAHYFVGWLSFYSCMDIT